MELLSRDTIRRALERLAEHLRGEGSRFELVLFGGAALVMLYNAREATKDVDVLAVAPEQTRTILRAARTVALEMDLPSDWMNDAAKGYLVDIAPGELILETETLVVRAAAPRQLLAMKLSAWRDDVDISDARLLLSKLSGTKEEVWAMVEPLLVPGRELKAQYAFADLWEAESGHR
ncbi:MAG TPA: DUF6036 family nucleotidyltransferase [Vicinamibacteria bacterium]|nr:DUF6036 family nucleotidyltransferase [Vicinamibacteria bacterium]